MDRVAEAASQQRRDVCFLPLSIIYYASRNIFLYCLIGVAVGNEWVSEHSGINFELWNKWLNWLTLITHASLLTKDTLDIGFRIEMSAAGLFKTLLPSVGTDYHLANAWCFVGVASATARHSTGWTFIVLNLLGSAAIFSMFLPLALALRSKYRSNPELALSFVCSHWPVVGARVVQPLGRCRSKYGQRMHILLRTLINQSTPWQWDSAVLSDAPLTCLEFIFTMVRSGSARAVVFVMTISLLKLVFIRLTQRALPTLVRKFGCGDNLVSHAVKHGLGSAYVLKQRFHDATEPTSGKLFDEAQKRRFKPPALITSTWADANGG